MKALALAISLPALTLLVAFVPARHFFEVGNLLSDGAVPADHVNPNLVNPWGLAASPTGPFWLANEGTGTSSIVLADGSLAAPDVNVPADNSAHSTGLVFNGGDGFVIEQRGISAPARFIFVSLEGRILAWSPTVDAANAIVVLDDGPEGAVYTGAALAEDAGAMSLYVANFAEGTIDAYDSHFHESGSFTDEDAPEGWSPFGIASIDDKLYVTFVPRDPKTGDEIPGPGNGLIDVFAPDGTLLERLVTGGELDAPWGLVVAPAGFGNFGHKLLVGNFGDGRILAYNIHNGHLSGQLRDEEGELIVIEGIWGLLFGNGGLGGDEDDLYFTAGIEDETHGLFGEIESTH